MESFEEQALRYGECRVWAPSQERLRSQDSSPADPPILERPCTKPLTIRRRYTRGSDMPIVNWGELHQDAAPPIQWSPPQTENTTQPEDRQARLASDLTKILGNGDDIIHIEGAALRLLDTFQEGFPLGDGGLQENLIKVAVQISNACKVHKRFDLFEKILIAVLDCGPIEEDLFFSFRPEGLIRACLEGEYDLSKGQKILSKERLRRACTIFLTKFKAEPNISSPKAESFAKLGLKLCTETCRNDLFTLTEDIFWRLDKYGTDASSPAIKYLITAVKGTGDTKRTVQYFRRFYVQQTSPSAEDFYLMHKAVVDSLIEIPSPDYKLAEEIMILALNMAERENLKVSTTSALKMIGTHWRSFHDINRVREIFDRFKPHFHAFGHPRAIYGALIQFYIESGNEVSALALCKEMRATYTESPDDNQDVRIRGHFAYSKAMRKDWVGVKSDFNTMAKLKPKADQLSAAFSPVLLLFAKTASIGEIEEFLREFIDEIGIQLTSRMSSLMIERYLQAREIESVSRWLDYMQEVGSPINTAFFDRLLTNCYRRWDFCFEEVLQLYLSVKALGKWTDPIITSTTEDTLRRIAVSASGSNGELASSRLILVDRAHREPIKEGDLKTAMATALALGDPHEVLNHYNRGLASQIPIDAGTVSIAIQASLRIDPNDINPTVALLQKSSESGYDISQAFSYMYIHQISKTYALGMTDCLNLQVIARKTLDAMDRQHLSISVPAITHTMKILFKMGQPRAAVDFWDSISRLRPLPLDVVTLTVILQAYLKLQDSAGPGWVVQMLRTHNLMPDKRFKIALKQGRKTAQSWAMQEAVHQAYDVVKEMRALGEKDKEIVKLKTISIMENAIKHQGIHESSINIESEHPTTQENDPVYPAMSTKSHIEIDASISRNTRKEKLGGYELRDRHLRNDDCWHEEERKAVGAV